MSLLKNIEGNWNGYIIQKWDNKEVVIPVTFQFKKEDLRLSGEAVIDTSGLAFKNIEKKDLMVIDLENVHMYEPYIQINYLSREDEPEQFGSFVIRLNESGKKLEGWFTGYSPESMKVIAGLISLEKATESS
ncbi:MAG: hypothetical protein IH947_05330 [Bacteroidetes bacterium]|nr:hypothetical protein [Bacteroidota bacterium]